MDKEIRISGDGKLTLTGSSTASDDKYNKAVFNQGTITIAIVVSKQVVGVMAFMVVIGYLITVMYA